MTDKTCPIHGLPSLENTDCIVCLRLLLAQAKALRIAEEEEREEERKRRIAAEAQLNSTFRELMKGNILVRNHTESSAHTNTGHNIATSSEVEVPKIELPESFWQFRPYIRKEELAHPINSETDVNVDLYILIREVIYALGFQDVARVVTNPPMMDAAPDLALMSVANRSIMFASVEGKKPHKTPAEREKIFGSGQQVTGEVCDQLFLTKIQLNSETFGLLSTFNGTQLVSTCDMSQLPPLKLEPIKQYFQASAVSSHRRSAESPSLTSGTSVEIRNPASGVKRQTSKKPKLQEPKKNGRINVATNEWRRHTYVSKVKSFGTDPQKNEECLALFATFVALSMNALKESLEKDFQIPITGEFELLPARAIRNSKNGDGAWGFTCISHDHGIQWHDAPGKNEKVFYSIRQLGYGETGVCCFALTESGAPCVLKIYLPKPEQDDSIISIGKKEAANWRHLYGDTFEFVHTFQLQGRIVLVMPFLEIAGSTVVRRRLSKGQSTSSLYKALLDMVEKGYYHNDLKWHHIGMHYSFHSGEASGGSVGMLSGNQGAVFRNDNPDIVFCDLASLEMFKQGTSSETKMKWVQDQFSSLQNRIDTEAD